MEYELIDGIIRQLKIESVCLGFPLQRYNGRMHYENDKIIILNVLDDMAKENKKNLPSERAAVNIFLSGILGKLMCHLIESESIRRDGPSLGCQDRRR